MSKDTSVQTSGVMTDKSGTTVVGELQRQPVRWLAGCSCSAGPSFPTFRSSLLHLLSPAAGTAQAAETADLLYAYHTPADAAASLLSLKQLLVTADSGTMSAYQVLSATLVAGKRLDFVVAAPTQDASGNGPVAEMIRIVISEEGVHEVRSGSIEQASGGGRRLLVTPSNSKASVTGLVTNTATSTCSGELRAFGACLLCCWQASSQSHCLPAPLAAPLTACSAASLLLAATSGGTCSKAATQMSCPPVPVCGMGECGCSA